MLSFRMKLRERKRKQLVSPKRFYMLQYILADNNFRINSRQKLGCPCFKRVSNVFLYYTFLPIECRFVTRDL